MKKLHPSGRNGKSLRRWLATWLQDRRRARRTPVLVAQYPSLAVWDWQRADPFHWNAYNSLDGGVTYNFDDFVLGTARQYAPDGGQHLMFIVGVDADGFEITGRSNAVRPDDAAVPETPVLAAPVIVDSWYTFGGTTPDWQDIGVVWTFDHGGFPVALIEVLGSLDGGDFYILGSVASSETQFTLAEASQGEAVWNIYVRYRNGTTVGPASNEVVIQPTV